CRRDRWLRHRRGRGTALASAASLLGGIAMLACDKRRIVVMLRWALLIALCFLVIYGRGASIQAIASSVALLLASNLVLMHLPDRVITARLFDPVLVIVDTISSPQDSGCAARRDRTSSSSSSSWCSSPPSGSVPS